MKAKKKLPVWRVIRIRKNAEYLTSLHAPDAKTAEDTVARDRGITEAPDHGGEGGVGGPGS